MIINNNEYKLCLFDTCTLSDFLQNPLQWIKYFDAKFGIGKTIICYSVFTLSELWYRQELFEKFIETFSVFPSALLDGHQSILNKEIDLYKTNTQINPIVLCPFAITENGYSPKEIVKKIFSDSDFISKTNYWKNSEEEVLQAILGLVINFPPKHSKYSINEIDFFNLSVSTNQLLIRNKSFAEKEILNHKEININKFPSLKTTSYVVFYKFYFDHRNPQISDVFDIIISSVLPYVDYFITERNMVEIIQTIQKRHMFLQNVTPIKLADCKKEIKII